MFLSRGHPLFCNDESRLSLIYLAPGIMYVVVAGVYTGGLENEHGMLRIITGWKAKVRQRRCTSASCNNSSIVIIFVL